MMKKYFEILGKKSKKAFEKKINKDTKNKVLNHYASSIIKYEKLILLQNKKDINYAKKIGLKSNFVSRLELNSNKIKAIVNSIKSGWLERKREREREREGQPASQPASQPDLK